MRAGADTEVLDIPAIPPIISARRGEIKIEARGGAVLPAVFIVSHKLPAPLR